MALLNAGRAGDAVAYLQKQAQMPAGEEADLVNAFLGLALQQDARANEATRTLRSVAPDAKNTNPSEGALLAQRLLGERPGVLLREERAALARPDAVAVGADDAVDDDLATVGGDACGVGP